jgi:hypothetical protein
VVEAPAVIKVVAPLETEVSFRKEEVAAKKENGFNAKSLGLLLIVLLVMFVSAGLAYPHRQGIHRMIKRNVKTIPKLLNRHMKTIFKGGPRQ